MKLALGYLVLGAVVLITTIAFALALPVACVILYVLFMCLSNAELRLPRRHLELFKSSDWSLKRLRLHRSSWLKLVVLLVGYSCGE
jgi:hypothetical protein